MATDAGDAQSAPHSVRRLGRLVLTAALLLTSGCSGEDAVTPVQQVDWRNGPYGVGCGGSEPAELVDGQSAASRNAQISFAGVGYAELDGRAGDEAVLQQTCGTEVYHFSVWTAGEDGPRLLGTVPGSDVRSWAADHGVLCVMFNLPGDDEDPPAEARPFRVGDSGVEQIQGMTCEVDGASSLPGSDQPGA